MKKPLNLRMYTGEALVHQNPTADNPFVAKIQKLHFVVDDSGLIFENYLVTTNICTMKLQMTKTPLDS